MSIIFIFSQSPDDSYGEEFDVDGDGEEARLMAIAKEAGIGTLSDGVPFGSAEFGDMALLAGEATDSELAELSAALAAMAEQRCVYAFVALCCTNRASALLLTSGGLFSSDLQFFMRSHILCEFITLSGRFPNICMRL